MTECNKKGRNSLRRASALLALAVTMAGVGCSAEEQPSPPPAAEQQSAKLLATIAIGGASKDAADTQRLRDTFATRLAVDHGGLYERTIDMDDKDASTVRPTRSAISDALQGLAQDVAARRAAGARTSVVLTLIGHGVTQDGVYRFLVAPVADESTKDASFTGDELAGMLAGIRADDLVVIFQSCESGTLVDSDDLGGLASSVQTGLNRADANVAIVVPVNGYVLSSGAWLDVLAEAFDAASDADRDGNVSYGELRERLERAACAHASFTPKAIYDDDAAYFTLPKVGVDPRFFSVGAPDTVALFPATTWTGAPGDAWHPPASFDGVSTDELCRSRTEDFALRYRKDVSFGDFFVRYQAAADWERDAWVHALAARTLEQDADDTARASVVTTLLPAVAKMSGTTRLDALSAIAAAAAPLASSHPREHEAATKFIQTTIERNDRVALEAALERLAPEAVYRVVRRYLGGSDVDAAVAALRKLDASWDDLHVPSADYAAIAAELSGWQSRMPSQAAAVIARVIGRTQGAT